MVDACRGRRNFLDGPVLCVAAGGIFDGRGLAAALALGACGVWVGTRFVVAEESHASTRHKEKVLAASSSDTIRTLAVTGRPLRLIPNDWVRSWEREPDRLREMCDRGVIPLVHDLEQHGGDESRRRGALDAINSLAGQAAGGVHAVESARSIIEGMVAEAAEVLRGSAALLSKL